MEQASPGQGAISVIPGDAGAKDPRWESATFVNPATTSISKTVTRERGHTKKSAERSAAHIAAAPTAAIAVGQTSKVITAVPTIDVAETRLTDQLIPQREHSSSQNESIAPAAASVPDPILVMSERKGPLQQSAEIPTPHGPLKELKLPVASSNLPAGTKDDSGSSNLPSQAASGGKSFERVDDANSILPVSAPATEESDAMSTRVIKDVIEMSVQEHIDNPGKRSKQSATSGEPRSLLPMPAIMPGMSGAEVESSPLKTAPLAVAGRARAANSDPFAIMDTSSAEPTPQLLHSSHQEVEIGLKDPTYGWIEVRTHRYAGEITASLSTSSTESHHNLGTQLAALTDYLSTREIPINKIVMGGMDAANTGGQGARHSGSDRQDRGSLEETAVGFAHGPPQPEETNDVQQSQYRRTSQIHLMA